MKILTYSIGLLASISVSVGYLFIVLQWLGGGNLFNYGIIILVFVFFPLLAVDRGFLKTQASRHDRATYMFGLSSGLLIGLSVVFKLLHLQGATLLLIAGAFLFAFGFLPIHFYRLYLKSLQT
jgi:hypothetical protein